MFLFQLAPLEGYSDAVFRTLCHKHGADMTFTEMTYIESLARGNKLALSRITAYDSTPVQIQFLTGREEQLELFLNKFKPFSGFAGFNLNLSCPSPEVIRQGKGAAMIKRVAKTEKLVSVIRKHGYPVSLKIRLGTNIHEKTMKVYLASIRAVDADFFVVHSKTASQESNELSDYSVYPECVDASNGHPIIANGDIDSIEKVTSLMNMGVSGVMIGRAAMQNPAVFDLLKNRLKINESNKPIPSLKELTQEYQSLYTHFGTDMYKSRFFKVLGAEIKNIQY